MEEMRDSEELIDRILYLQGHPNLQRLNPLAVGETQIEQIRLALELEHRAVRNLNSAINRCLELDDQGTREFLAGMIADEEEHADYWESQLDAISQIEAALPRPAAPPGPPPALVTWRIACVASCGTTRSPSTMFAIFLLAWFGMSIAGHRRATSTTPSTASRRRATPST